MKILFSGTTMDLRLRLPARLLPSVSMQTKITIISVTFGLSLLGFVANMLKRRKRSRPKSLENIINKSRNQNISANGEVIRGGTNVGPHRHNRQGSICSVDRQSVRSLLTVNMPMDPLATSELTPQQLGTMGMEALQTAIAYWEDALKAYSAPPDGPLALADAEEVNFTHMLEKIVEKALDLQENCVHLFLDSNSVLFKSETQSVISSRHDRITEPERRTVTSMSSVESFVSAQAEIADLADFDEYESNVDLRELTLYQTALKKNEEGAIPIRLLRTEMVRCQSNREYIAKVHCIRVAFQLLFQREEIRSYFIEVGSRILTGLMLRGERDPKLILAAYESIISFSKDKRNWPKMEDELQERGVKCLSFYDVVLDFIVLDAFEDLENPPSSVTAVVQNRWLSNGFKETALSTAVWSVLKAKSRMLKYPDGFISHFYQVSEHLIPVLAWGFYGPDDTLKDICLYFKEEVMGFMFDIFSFNKVRFTRIEDLASDIMQLANLRFDRTIERLYN
ncbi:Mitoguardin like protein [Argiope bruennichi]|uniref:Mitoguardin like protein n=2 Tax=Argiope bruennichi TaxID=94029 RepID=A0A8T0FP94_ARGBR|nr:Mitoguardin like protein [Argiope bruennichi]